MITESMMHKKKLSLSTATLALLTLILATCGTPQPTNTVPSPTETPPVPVEDDVVYAQPLQPDLIAYGLDVYTPGKPGNWPVVVFLYGYAGNKEDFAATSQAIADQGAVVFTIDWPAPLPDHAGLRNGSDCREVSEVLSCAIRYARSTAPDHGGDPSNVTLVGFSAGAAFGSWVALTGGNLDRAWEEFAAARGGPPPQVECAAGEGSAAVDAFVGIGGNYDYAEPLQKRDPDLWEIVSPYANVGQDLGLRIRLLHGERDSIVSPEHSVNLNDLLVAEGYDSRLILFTDLTTEQILSLAADSWSSIAQPY
jgi:acetyl esterase/lipase